MGGKRAANGGLCMEKSSLYSIGHQGNSNESKEERLGYRIRARSRGRLVLGSSADSDLGRLLLAIDLSKEEHGLTRDHEGEGESERSIRNCLLLLFFRFSSRKVSFGRPTPIVGEVIATSLRNAPHDS